MKKKNMLKVIGLYLCSALLTSCFSKDFEQQAEKLGFNTGGINRNPASSGSAPSKIISGSAPIKSGDSIIKSGQSMIKSGQSTIKKSVKK